MRARVLVPALLALLASTSAQAAVQIDIDKDTQTMTVAVDGVAKHRWPVSSGLPSYETPNGSYKAFRMEEDHYSKEWDEAPMPHSIFFTRKGHAIHGTDAASRLGNPASHGCVRLSRANAATLFALVKAEGLSNTTVTLSGSSQVALARSPQRRNDVASRDVAPQPTEPQVPQPTQPQVQMYDGTARAAAAAAADHAAHSRHGRLLRRIRTLGAGRTSLSPFVRGRLKLRRAAAVCAAAAAVSAAEPVSAALLRAAAVAAAVSAAAYAPAVSYGQPRYYRREYDTYGY